MYIADQLVKLRDLEAMFFECHGIGLCDTSSSHVQITLEALISSNRVAMGGNTVRVFTLELYDWMNAWFRFKFIGGLFQQQYMPVPFISRWLVIVEFIEPLYFLEQFDNPVGYYETDVRLAFLDEQLRQLLKQKDRPFFQSLKTIVVNLLAQKQYQFTENAVSAEKEFSILQGAIDTISAYAKTVFCDSVKKVLQDRVDTLSADVACKMLIKDTAQKNANWAEMAIDMLLA